jgi:hypothetical protein
MSTPELGEMLGATIKSIVGEKGDDRMIFYAEDGRQFHFYHSQNCCESVDIEDVCGDLADLLGSPLVLAEETSSEEPEPVREYEPDSCTWTFYRFGTAKGAVTVRWYGESNGYYSEGVDFHVEAAPSEGKADG